MQSEFESLFQESIKDIDMTPGSIVNATVIDIKEDFIVISAGLKSEVSFLEINLLVQMANLKSH